MITDRRAIFAALAGLGGIGALTRGASADTPFTTFSYPATKPDGTGTTPASRTTPVRLGAWANVIDFGADPTGVVDSTSAIQAAVNWTSNAGRGVVFVPAGTYLTSSAVTYNNANIGIHFLGCGLASTITGNFAGFILDRSLSPSDNPTSDDHTIEKLNIVNGNAAGGGVRMGSTVGGAIRDMTISAFQCIQANDSDGGASQSVTIENCQLSSGGLGGATVGVSATGNASIINCDMSGFDTGISADRTSGVTVQASRIEVCRTGINLGPSVGLNGCVILGGTMESCGTAIRAGTTNFLFAGFKIQGFEGAAPYGSLSAVGPISVTGTISGATATCSVAANTGIATLSSVTGTFQPGTDFITGSGLPTGTSLASQLTGTAGKAGTYQLKGSPQYGIQCIADGTLFGAMVGVECNPQAYVACFYIPNDTNRGGVVFIGCHAANASTLGGIAWQLPTAAHNANWINCDIQPTFLFAGLPSGGNVRQGDQYFITDANTATLGNSVTAGGSPNTAGYVVWNGTNWTLASK